MTGRLDPTPGAAGVPAPSAVLFDWHGTLADTMEAMYATVDEMLTQLDDLKLLHRIVDPGSCSSADDAKLVRFVKMFRRLHPKVKSQKRIARTDIFEIMFGVDEGAKIIAHDAYNRCYFKHSGKARPLHGNVRPLLHQLRQHQLPIGVVTNRNRTFLDEELRLIDTPGWGGLFDVTVSGDEVAHRKPAPDGIIKALQEVGAPLNETSWYIGDSVADTISAKSAGISHAFINHANWDQDWLRQLFPHSENQPYVPDIILPDFHQLGIFLLQLISPGEPLH